MSGSIRRRGKSSWELKFDIGRDPVTGKRKTQYKNVKGTKKDAQRELRRLLNSLDEGQFVEPSKVTVGEFVNWWLENDAVHQVEPRTLAFYQDKCHRHIIPDIGSIQLQKLQPIQVQELYNRKVQSGRLDGRGGLSPRSVVHIDRTLNVVLKRARQLRLIASNPVDDAKPPAIPKNEIDVFSDEEIKQLLEHISDTHMYAPIYLIICTGLRRGEALALRWQDIEFDRKRLKVRHSLEELRPGGGQKPTMRLKAPKTRSSKRTISLPHSAIEVLTQHGRTQAEEWLKLGLNRPDGETLLFTKRDGEMYMPHRFGKRFAEACHRAGLGHRTLHSLRHTHITNLLRAGVHVKVASERAGHSTVSVTLDLYAHVLEDMQDDAAERVDASMKRALGG